MQEIERIIGLSPPYALDRTGGMGEIVTEDQTASRKQPSNQNTQGPGWWKKLTSDLSERRKTLRNTAHEHSLRLGRIVLGLTFVLLVAAPVAGLAIAAASADGSGYDYSAWAEGIAGSFLFSLSVLFFATGPRRFVAKQDVGYTIDGQAKTVKAGEPVPSEAVASLAPASYRKERGAFFRTLFIGKDGRWSTSKLQALLWTYAVGFGLLALVVAKWLGNSQGFDHQVDQGLQDEYLLLLGGPFAAAVLARAITTTQVEQGNVEKPPSDPTLNPVQGASEVISDDAGAARRWRRISCGQHPLVTVVRLVARDPSSVCCIAACDHDHRHPTRDSQRQARANRVVAVRTRDREVSRRHRCTRGLSGAAGRGPGEATVGAASPATSGTATLSAAGIARAL
jgi:hypothetical protein